MLKTPVLFLIFNRPDTTKKVFEAIRNARPEKLFVAADGPRQNKLGEAERCEESRKIAVAVDWDCEVKTLFRKSNMGCGESVSNAITWFFSFVDEGIILEDDCLPSQDFFRFCVELLEHYRNDNRIMQIGGNNLLQGELRDKEYSYSFSNHNYIWGWATWKRAWQYYDYKMLHYEEVKRKRYYQNYFGSYEETDYFDYVFNRTYRDISTVDTWDYQWQFLRMLQSGVSIVPINNLVINLGLGIESTHTSSHHRILNNMTLEMMDFPLRHPEFVMVDRWADQKNFNNVLVTKWWRVKSKIKRITPKMFLKYWRRNQMQ